MPADFTAELEAALQAARIASRVCQSVQSAIAPDALEKKDRSPVTVADFASQAVVCRHLSDAFPDDPVVGEEESDDLRTPENARYLDRIRSELSGVGVEASADEVCGWIDLGNGGPASRFWTLDPVDGTKGFLRGEQYAISLALLIEGRIVVGVLACPNLAVEAGGETRGALFSAVRGSGAFVEPLAGGERRPVSVSDVHEPSEIRLCESVESGHSSHDRSARIGELLAVNAAPVRLDSQAKYAVVARGEADAYLRLPTRKGYEEKIWDHAGGVLVVQEAGGTVTDTNGHPLDFGQGRTLSQNSGVIVTNGRLHAPVLEAVRATAEG